MKVSGIIERGMNSMNSMNLSNEFVDKNLYDQIPYKVIPLEFGESNDHADRFINKQRIVKEKTSLGGFRIPQETLKKRVNPSEILAAKGLINDPEINSFSFNHLRGYQSNLGEYAGVNTNNGLSGVGYENQNNPNASLYDNNPTNELLFDPNLNPNLNPNINPNRDLSSNLIQMIDREVEKLKRESAEYMKVIETSKSQSKNPVPEVDENKVMTQYMAYNPDRVQAIKHVSTQLKPEYMSLEELQKLKDEHMKKMLEIENEFYAKKRRESEASNRVSKGSEDARFNKLMEMEMKHNESRKITPDELTDILRHEDEFARTEQNRKKSMKERAKSVKTIKRAGVPSEKAEMPLDREEERFVKKYANYVMKKKLSRNEEDEEDGWWNTTKIKSQNANGVVNRPDGLPGHINIDDYSMYYYSIGSTTPKSLSVRSVSRSRSRGSRGSRGSRSVPKRRINRSKSEKRITSGHKSQNPHLNKSTNKSNNLQMNSHLAFTKLIFNLLDKEKKGIVSKSDIATNLNLDDTILRNLGFASAEEFQEGLRSFPSQSEGTMTEQEVIGFLLSRSELAEEYLFNYRNHMEEGNMREENNFEFNNYEEVPSNNPNDILQFNINPEEEEYPGMSTKQMDFLQYPSTQERLEKLRESYNFSSGNNFNVSTKHSQSKNNSSIKHHNKNLTSNLKEKIKSKGPKVQVTYKDYSDFLSKYKCKGGLNFTVPKPFEFLKKDYSQKKMEKIQEILEERRRKEEEILGFKFRANELKREIFISQFENVIEAEKVNRKHRTEKLKEKIVQEMKPFSFYEQDERKYKEKITKVSEPPQFMPFKANPVPWTSQVTMYDDIIKKVEVERQGRIELRAMETQKAAKLPPRMEMHEKKKKQQEQEMKLLENTQIKQRSKSFKANAIPNFSKAHESFMKTLEKKKAIAKPTEPVPFNFHEPKKKASLRGYLDQENDPQVKNPQFKRNITEIIQKIQQKPKIEPASTKALNLLMATRRKELEDKQRKEEEKILEDKMRKEKQERLKERVVGSKALVDNSKALEEKRIRQQEDFKRGLQEKKQNYQQDLARRLQKVYNKPLMFEAGKSEKFSINKNMRDKLQDVLGNKNEKEEENDDNLYDGKFDDA